MASDDQITRYPSNIREKNIAIRTRDREATVRHSVKRVHKKDSVAANCFFNEVEGRVTWGECDQSFIIILGLMPQHLAAFIGCGFH
ncbi:hypothetical protein BPOR_0513g00100 [Botrytis porri]|uniref:Uncharacterized protein n=1 Tax=Botrytis porri TaxID=87229 RepID=A0A4Z1KEB0_9HELO|nr:hypothetical protein BPOR_0513g00100 [Botrytis porri]